MDYFGWPFSGEGAEVGPVTFNISNGLGLGFILFAVTHLASGRARQLMAPVYIVVLWFAAFFAIRFGS